MTVAAVVAAVRRAVLRLPPLRTYQLPILHSRAVDTVVIGTVQAGKGFVAACWVLMRAWAGGPGLLWWWCAPTYEQAKHGFRLVVRLGRAAGIVASSTTQPPLYAVLKNGARIEAKSFDQPLTLMGATVAGAVIDEFSALPSDAYGALTSRRAATLPRGLGHYLWIGNAGEDVGGPAEELTRRAESGAPGFAMFTWTWRDLAGALPCRCAAACTLDEAHLHRRRCERGIYLRYVERERGRLSKAEWERLFEARWTEGTSLPVYSEFDRAVHVRDDVTLQPGLPLILSCDFNVDPMAWVVGQTHQGEFWCIDEIAIAGGATTEAACREFLRRYPDLRREVIVYGDASGNARKTSATRTDYQTIAAMIGTKYASVDLRNPNANPPVLDRIGAVNAALRNAAGDVRLVLHPRCKLLSRDLARVSWKAGTRDIDKSDRSLTHFSDALGYAIYPTFERDRGGSYAVAVGLGDDPMFDGGILTMDF